MFLEVLSIVNSVWVCGVKCTVDKINFVYKQSYKTL